MPIPSHALPLPLTRPLSAQPPAHRLPFALARPLGTLPTTPTDPTDPPAPPSPPRRMTGVVGWISTALRPATTLQTCIRDAQRTVAIADDCDVVREAVQDVAGCQTFMSLAFTPIARCQATVIEPVLAVVGCHTVRIDHFTLLANCAKPTLSPTIAYTACATAISAPVVAYQHCVRPTVQAVVNYGTSVSYTKATAQVARQQTAKVQPAVPVPCRYYPIPEPPPDKPTLVCRIRPLANALPMPLTRRRRLIPASALPMPLMCWHDELPPVIPSLRSYIVHNVITASIGGIAVDLLGFGIRTDIDSYCWQGNVEISARDYQRIKHKLDVPRGNEPLINVTINNFTFAIICEEQSRSRQFANYTYSLSGRSITAGLSADYARANAGMLTQANYASQIVNQQLANLPFTVGLWQIPDWLIPANEYSVTGKTPIAVIDDIAKVAGGFVCSDATGTALSLKPRWRKPAWELATATADLIVQIDVVHKIDDRKRTNPRYNTVTLISNVEGGHVYRQREGQDRAAPTQTHPLYTDKSVIIASGQAILSDSGLHRDYMLTLPWSGKYDIALAELGQIWQVNDTTAGGDGNWRGIVTGVSVSVEMRDGAPCVYQTVSIDRYMDV